MHERSHTHNSQTAPEPDPAPEKLFGATLYPHRSLSRRHYNRMIAGLLLLCLIAAFRFFAVGAWPVVIFVTIDILALWLAFHLSYRQARLHENIRLSAKDLIVTRVQPNGSAESWRFDPYWVQVKLVATEGGDDNMLVFSSHGERLQVGAFLTAAERRSLAEKLWRAMAPLKGR
ncbi:MAG: DUF2244 domain-containing protein [Alphaproteobacteria bacterium]|nr:MAG: DUF2244 domain-containing protein [Alphaproteobacteria bacterium]